MSDEVDATADEPGDPELAEADAAADPGDEADVALTVEGLIDDLDRVSAERDAYLDDSRRIAADFANFRRQTEKRNLELVAQANARLVEGLLPTLDACEAALRHGATDIEPVQAALLAVLEREGLTRMHPEGEPFDPARHEAVLHEPADDDAADGPVILEVLRTGYQLHDRVLRPAMVKVRG